MTTTAARAPWTCMCAGCGPSSGPTTRPSSARSATSATASSRTAPSPSPPAPEASRRRRETARLPREPGRLVSGTRSLPGDAGERSRGVRRDALEVVGEGVDVEPAEVLAGAALEGREVVATIGQEVVGDDAVRRGLVDRRA